LQAEGVGGKPVWLFLPVLRAQLADRDHQSTFSEWPQIFGDERLTGALLDRLTHRVHIIEMQGESYRLKKSKKQKEGGKTTQTKS
jgi:hypothetical protein